MLSTEQIKRQNEGLLVKRTKWKCQKITKFFTKPQVSPSPKPVISQPEVKIIHETVHPRQAATKFALKFPPASSPVVSQPKEQISPETSYQPQTVNKLALKARPAPSPVLNQLEKWCDHQTIYQQQAAAKLVLKAPPAPSLAFSQPVKKLDLQTLQQRQAAAKLALRKQLEKEPLPIPLPKPHPMKLNFFPSANDVEFLCLLGLDCVQDFLTETKTDSSREKPVYCAQCFTDFASSWERKEIDKNGEKACNVLCEACMNSNIRKALAAQYINSLTASLKARQQEKETD